MNTDFAKRHWKLAFGATLLILLLAFALSRLTGPYLTVVAWQLIAAVLAVVGAVVATDAWMQRVRAGGATIWIIVGALFVAGSSIVSTLGWNGLSDWKQARDSERSFDEERRAVLIAVHREMIASVKRLNQRAFVERDEEDLKEKLYILRPQTIALANAITCGLFNGKRDGELRTKIYLLHDVLTELSDAVVYLRTRIMGGESYVTNRKGLNKVRDLASRP